MNADRAIANPFLATEAPSSAPTDSRVLVTAAETERLRAAIASLFAKAVAAAPPDSVCEFDTVYGGRPGMVTLCDRLLRHVDDGINVGVDSALVQETRDSYAATNPEWSQLKLDAGADRKRYELGSHVSPLFEGTSVLLHALEAANKRGDHQEARKVFDRILEVGAFARDAELDDEMCWGRAGFLLGMYSVLEKYQHVYSSKETVQALVTQIADAMVSRCSQAPETPLSTICYGNSYHGVGHGTAGLVLALLRYPYLTTLHAPTIHVTLAHLLEVRLPNGNWPKGPTDAHGALVHWCHGAPGMAILFAIAARAFPEREEYLRAALAAGDVTWERGLLRKGIGLCHGVCGNAYAFLYLHEVTREERWLWRAARFADFATEWEALEEQGTMKHEDMPWSLFDGATGAIVFWADLLSVAEGKGMVGFPFCFESVSP